MAIKVLAPMLAREHEFVQRFKLEAKVFMELSLPQPHPNIVQVENFGSEPLSILMDVITTLKADV